MGTGVEEDMGNEGHCRPLHRDGVPAHIYSQ
jgi:hypothetical protein